MPTRSTIATGGSTGLTPIAAITEEQPPMTAVTAGLTHSPRRTMTPIAEDQPTTLPMPTRGGRIRTVTHEPTPITQEA